MELKCAETTGPLIDLFFSVHRTLGFGFLECVYSKAMMIAGKKTGLDIRSEVPINVYFESSVIGQFKADLIVNNSVVVELKACRAIDPEHEAQLLNYLKTTSYEVGFLFNFGPTARYKRMVFDNVRKGQR